MTVPIFVGPTLRPQEIAGIGEFVLLPPVAQGDVYRAARRKPRAIGVIDGYFAGAPSVWHKEILWAISQGIEVFGSASMGALRAAELHEFGMRGVGRIFEAFRDGRLEDDDEVAIVHGPAEIGYLSASEAMVNFRSTFDVAVTEGVLSAPSRQRLEAFAKSLYFADRTWSAVLEGAAMRGVDRHELAALRDWLPSNRVDQKRLDALEMLAAIKETLAAPAPARPTFQFEWTYLWDEFVGRSGDDTTGETPSARHILDELRLEGPEAYGRVEKPALLRMIAAKGADRLSAPSQEALRATLTDLRARLGLYSRAALDSWMAKNDLDQNALESLIEDEANANALRERAGRALEPHLLGELQLSGAYPRLAERARKKGETIAALAPAGAGGAGKSSVFALRLWYFEERLRRAMPDDIQGFLRQVGFADAAAFDAALQREWSFLKAAPRHD
jgi:hypothetical protein